MYIDLTDDKSFLTSEERMKIIDLLEFVAEKESIGSNTEISVTFVNNDEIKEINQTYRNNDEATDCLSFAFEDDLTDENIHYPNELEPPRMLGDIIISVEKAKEQAEEYNHSFSRELGFLVVHGFLHLLGYDHMTEEEEKEMFQKQRDLLGAFGLERA